MMPGSWKPPSSCVLAEGLGLAITDYDTVSVRLGVQAAKVFA